MKVTILKEIIEKTDFEESCGNIFADLGSANAEEKFAKAKIAIEIRRVIQERELTQKAAAKILGIDQPTVSKLLKGQLRGLSTGRLLRFLMHLDQDITITIKPSSGNQRTGKIQVVV